MSLLHPTRRFLSVLYIGLLVLLVWISACTRLEWMGIVPVWFLHLAAFSYFCINYLPLSRSILSRVITLAYKRNEGAKSSHELESANFGATCCSESMYTKSGSGDTIIEIHE